MLTTKLIISYMIALVLLTSCDRTDILSIENQKDDSLFVFTDTILAYIHGKRELPVIRNSMGRKHILLLKNQRLDISMLYINKLKKDDIYVDTLLIYNNSDTLKKYYSKQDIYEDFSIDPHYKY